MKTIQFQHDAGPGGSGSVTPRRKGRRHHALGLLAATLLLALPVTVRANTPPVANAGPDLSVNADDYTLSWDTAMSLDGDCVVFWRRPIPPPLLNRHRGLYSSPLSANKPGDYVTRLAG